MANKVAVASSNARAASDVIPWKMSTLATIHARTRLRNPTIRHPRRKVRTPITHEVVDIARVNRTNNSSDGESSSSDGESSSDDQGCAGEVFSGTDHRCSGTDSIVERRNTNMMQDKLIDIVV